MILKVNIPEKTKMFVMLSCSFGSASQFLYSLSKLSSYFNMKVLIWISTEGKKDKQPT